MTGGVIQADGRRWTTYQHASELLGVPVNTLRWWVHVHRVTAKAVTGRVWLDLEEAEDAERDQRRRAAVSP